VRFQGTPTKVNVQLFFGETPVAHTSSIRDNLSPQWNESVLCSCEVPEGEVELRLIIVDENRNIGEKIMGMVVVPVEDIKKKKTLRMISEVEPCTGCKSSGGTLEFVAVWEDRHQASKTLRFSDQVHLVAESDVHPLLCDPHNHAKQYMQMNFLLSLQSLLRFFESSNPHVLFSLHHTSHGRNSKSVRRGTTTKGSAA
jgi:hypothetical protein